MNTTADTFDGVCDGADCTLREAIFAANDGDTINFSVTGTITLTNGNLFVFKNVTISGPGANSLSVNANAISRVFRIAGTVTISGLTITNGNDDPGGGIFNEGTLTLTKCTISGNSAGTSVGGGIFNLGNGRSVTANNCTISGNTAGSGAGIGNQGDSIAGTVTLNNSTISGNSATETGGAIYNIVNSNGTSIVTINNCTLNGNSAAGSGAAGGIFTGSGDATGTALINLGHTILNAGSSGSNIVNSDGTIQSYGYNLSSDAAGGDGATGPGGFLNHPGDIRNTNPNLGPLQDNGGPTFTHKLLGGSPAIDAGAPVPEFDQRGPSFARVINGRLDIGAFEAQLLALKSAVSSALHGLSGPFEINLPLTGQPGIECRSTDGNGGDGSHLVLFTFSNQISSVDSVSVSCGTVTSQGANGSQYSVQFDGSACNQQWVTLTLNGVHDTYGQTLASAAVTVGLLLGDTTGNGSVNSSDVAQTQSQSGMSLSASNFREDVNVTGDINSSDISLVQAQSGTALGSPPAAPNSFVQSQSGAGLGSIPAAGKSQPTKSTKGRDRANISKPR